MAVVYPMTDYMLTGLVKRRAEMAGELEAMHERIRKLVADMEHLDATIRIVAPDYEPETISPKMFRPPQDWSGRGQMSRMVLSIVRTAKEPITSREIAARMILERGLAMDDKLLRLMTKRVSTALRDQREKGRVTSEQGPGTYALWSIVASR
jgi:hypothetical protein